MEIFRTDSFDDDLRFKIRLQAYLRLTAIKISSLRHEDDKFMPYIKEREYKLKELLKCSDDFQIFDGEKKIFP
ncbi:MAG: hypothetical protein AAE985_04995 [Thermoplasmataceae archaeon]|jgi:hypothetical protein|nr:MAG: hypothetical protein AMDU2_EPLC00005G0553 [Thermoplasmatales archaeon E-plasma]MCL4348220.1 hypothetical protein [Candidatus Thermoplasmatota archaeon]MCL5787053.1 hypothetical protein [Candidatus Thermoplasmatota archaeon]